MNGYLKGLQTAWNNKAVQNTLAGVGGFRVGLEKESNKGPVSYTI